MWTRHDLVAAFGGCCGYLDRRPLTAYLAAAGCVLAAMAIRAALGLVSPGLVPFAVLYPAFTAAALVGGLGPGLAALALGLLSSWWLPPAAATASLPLNLALLAVTGGALVGLATTLRFAIVSLLAGRERLELAIRTTGLGTWDFDGRTGVRRWSKEFREIIGLEETAPADPTLFAQLIHPDDRDRVNQRYRAAHDPAGDGWYEAQFRIRRADDGTEKWLAATGRMFFAGDGGLARAAGTILDITARRDADVALRESEERYRTLIETAPDAVHVHRDGVIILANQQAADLFGGREPADIIGRTAMSLVDEASLAVARVRTGQLDASGRRNPPVEMILRRLDGSTVAVEASSAAVMLDGKLAIQAVLRDITERRRSEAALRASETRFRLAAAAVQGIVYDLDLRTGSTWRSDGLERVLGIAPEAVAATEHWWEQHIHPEDAPRVARDGLLLNDPKVSHLDREYRVRHADGHWVHLHDRSFVVRDGEGRAQRLIGVSTDISERKAAEARQLLLTREVDHRARNALSVVLSLVRMTKAADPRDFAQAVEGRVAALARAHTLLADNGWRGTDLRAVVEEELAGFRHAASVAVSGPVVALRAESVQPLALVLHELVTNAAKHGALSTPNGRVQISWHHDPLAGVALRWDETDGPPVARPPEHCGFGSTLIQATVLGQLGGKLALTWRPQGLLCELAIPPCPQS